MSGGSNPFFHKPELALRRAIELEHIQQDDAALALLHEVLSSRRHRTWSPAYEGIMMKYVNLCLKLHKSREAKDGLHQYRNLSQTQAPGSLEKVMLHLLEQAELQCQAAKQLVDAESLAHETSLASDSPEDDEFGVSPQSILMTTMSTDPAKSQRDSTLLMPALKFLWEIYRTVLDILRSNSKLEHVYHKAAQNALQFCRNYKRRVEFRHLCEMLRSHLGNLRQYGIGDATADDFKANSKVRGWEGWSTESIELHLQTRFAQLETASDLHRYQEGFRTVEDIYNILQISQARKKPPKAKLMANYYEKLTTLFWVSENYLFHAFAAFKFYGLSREYNRGMTPEMKEMQASAVLLAALCIPQTQASAKGNKEHGIASTAEDDIVKQKMARMATLLGFQTRNPTREALLQEIKAKNILDEVPQYFRDLYDVLESNADPLIMVEKTRPFLEQLKARVGEEGMDDIGIVSLGRYVKPLTKVLLLKLVISLSSAYHTVSIDHLKKLTSGLDMTFEQVEKAIVLLTQTKALSVRIDHRAGCLRFGNTDLESHAMRSQLTTLAKQLEAVNQVLAPADSNLVATRRSKLYEHVRANLQSENTAILERKKLVEDRKEEAERIAQEKTREEARRKAEEEAARRAEDDLRMQREQRLREVEKQKKIQQELEHKEKLRFLRATMGKKAEEITAEKLDAIDADALQREHEEKLRKKKEDAERKQKETAKKLDYLVRAIRIEELPLIKKKYEERVARERTQYEQDNIEKIKKATSKWESDVKEKQLLDTFGAFQYIAEFHEQVMVGRKAQHEAACRVAEERAELDAERGKLERAKERKADEARRIVEDEERRLREEEEARLEAERQAREDARREKEVKEEAAREKELQRMDDERRRKELEKGPTKYVPPSKRGGDAGGGGDRVGAGIIGGVGSSSRSGNAGTGGSSYPGGGRYDSKTRDRAPGPPSSEGNSRWRN
ncbi:hypothetical protein MPSEU_000251200 [Mayamaea pseudoterrestris]|nr:hypothetical protein MPSEU_000251200 [Mayamaea pseudoterrestris]